MNRFSGMKKWRKQRGQTLVFLTVFLVVFLLFIGLAVDFGLTFLTRARLTKAVDAACLNAARNYTSTDSGALAQAVATSAFSYNYGSYSRDTTPPAVTVTATQDPNNAANMLLNCSCTATSKTFFMRVLPSWSTVSVTDSAVSKRATLVMTLVVDRSGSMSGDGGWSALKNAVPKFLAYFDNVNDYVGLVSFASYSTVDVPITTTPGNFKTPIQTALNSLSPNGYTFSQGGLSNAITENNIPHPAGNVFKVIVFLTDGYANIINDNLSCPGYANVNYGGCDPSQGSGCNTVTFLNPANGNTLCSVSNNGHPSCCAATQFYSYSAGGLVNFTATNTYNDSVYRALQLATNLRTDANPTTIYSIGVGNSVNTTFLQEMANDPASPTFDSTQPIGAAIFVPSCTSNNATCNADVLQAYQNIAANILLRLTQ